MIYVVTFVKENDKVNWIRTVRLCHDSSKGVKLYLGIYLAPERSIPLKVLSQTTLT